MKRACLVFGLLSGAGVLAAEPPSSRPPTIPATAPRAATATPTPATKPAPVQKLDLRVGDVRNYMTPDEFRALITGQDEERNTIVVQAEVPLVPMKSVLDVPGGILAPFWALAHPTNAWRLFLPDARVNIQNIPPLETKVPPPFRAGVPTF